MKLHAGMRRRHAFTLVEIVVAVLIISILAGIALVSYQYFQERSRKEAARIVGIYTAKLIQTSSAQTDTAVGALEAARNPSDQAQAAFLSLPYGNDIQPQVSRVSINSKGDYVVWVDKYRCWDLHFVSPRPGTAPEGVLTCDGDPPADNGGTVINSDVLKLTYDPSFFAPADPVGTQLNPQVLDGTKPGTGAYVFDILDSGGQPLADPSTALSSVVSFSQATGKFTLDSSIDAVPVSAIASGGYGKTSAAGGYSCALIGDQGTLRCWGANTSSRLGVATPASSNIPLTVQGLAGVRKFSLGDQAACAVLTSGSVSCWGSNASKQISPAATATFPAPTQVPGVTAATDVVVSQQHSCALLSTGRVLCWGTSTPLDSATTDVEPYLVAGITNAKSLAGSATATCALLQDSTVSCWGTNLAGQLGSGQTAGLADALLKFAPTLVKDLSGSGALTGVKAISGGYQSFCAVMESGSVSCWGSNIHGELGNGSTTSSNIPVAVSSISDASSIALGYQQVQNNAATDGGTACVTRSSGAVSCWGNNTYSQLGDGSTATATSPVDVPSLTGATSVTTSGGTSCALLTDKSVKCWGFNTNGATGTGVSGSSVTVPTLVQGTGSSLVVPPLTVQVTDTSDKRTATAVVDISAQFTPTSAALAVSYPPAVLSADSATTVPPFSTQFGLPSAGVTYAATSNVGNLPTDVSFSTSTGAFTAPSSWTWKLNPLAVASGVSHTCALIETGSVVCWGANNFGQLGMGTTSTSRATPQVVPGLGGVLQITAGSNFTCALLSNGTVRCWGANGSGQLGDGTLTTRTSPVSVLGLRGVDSISAGETDGMCALLSDATARCWGSASTGYAGSGTWASGSTPSQGAAPSQWTPQVVESAAGQPLTGVERVVAAGYGGCALVNSGQTYCWGLNDFGQAQPGSTAVQYYAKRIASLPTATHIAGGNRHYCVVTDSSSVMCWGNDTLGQSGSDPAAATCHPTAITECVLPQTVISSGARYLSLAGDSSCAIMEDRSVRCWGENRQGQLGVGWSPRPVLEPTPIPGLAGVTNLSLGPSKDGAMYTDGGYKSAFAHACAIANQALVCWGSNASGESLSPIVAAGARTLPFYAVPPTTVTVSATDSKGSYSLATVNLSRLILAPPPVSIAYSSNSLADSPTPGTSGSTGTQTFSQASTLPLPSTVNFSTSTGTFSGTAPSQWGFTVRKLAMSTGSFACAIDGAKRVRCWGDNNYKQLGNGTTIDSSTPVYVQNVTDAVDIAVGASYACATTEAGQLWCWGAGLSGPGQVGSDPTLQGLNGTAAGSVSVGSAWVGATEEFGHVVCAVLTNGTVDCWQVALAGSSAQPTTLGRTSCSGGAPLCTEHKPAAGVTDARTVAVAGGMGACVTTTSGTVECWGSSILGTGAASSAAAVTVVNDVDGQPLTGVASLATAPAFTQAAGHTASMCALLNSGTVSCWGGNLFGQLGDGSYTTRAKAAPVVGLDSVSSLAASAFYQTGGAGTVASNVCATRTNGQLWCWGAGARGQLGGSAALGPVSLPLRVLGLPQITSVATGSQQVCALTADTINCFGLVQSATVPATLPVPVLAAVTDSGSWGAAVKELTLTR